MFILRNYPIANLLIDIMAQEATDSVVEFGYFMDVILNNWLSTPIVVILLPLLIPFCNSSIGLSYITGFGSLYLEYKKILSRYLKIYLKLITYVNKNNYSYYLTNIGYHCIDQKRNSIRFTTNKYKTDMITTLATS